MTWPVRAMSRVRSRSPQSRRKRKPINRYHQKESLMAGKNTAAFGIYSDRTSVESAVDALKANGYRNTDISVLFPETTGTKDFAHEKHTKAPEGATAGAGTGAVV